MDLFIVWIFVLKLKLFKKGFIKNVFNVITSTLYELNRTLSFRDLQLIYLSGSIKRQIKEELNTIILHSINPMAIIYSFFYFCFMNII